MDNKNKNWYKPLNKLIMLHRDLSIQDDLNCSSTHRLRSNYDRQYRYSKTKKRIKGKWENKKT